MTADRDRYRTLTAWAVLLVAAIAAVVSYLHVASLAIRYGQPPVAAYLLPVSIDGLVTVASLVMLRAARAGVSTPWLARTGLSLAVLATLACNVAYGLPHGWPGALLSGWPAVSFVVAAEMAISMSRKRPQRGHERAPEAATVRTSKRTPAAVKRTDGRTHGADSEAAILTALANDPAMTTGQLADVTGLSDRTVRRVRSRLNGAAVTSIEGR